MTEMTETLIPGPPTTQEEGGGEEEAFIVFVQRTRSPEGRPAPFTMDWGDGNTLVLFSERELAEQFVASPPFVEVERVGIVKGTRAEAFIKVLGAAVESGYIEAVLVNANPLHEWEQGNYQGHVVDALELHADLKDAYRDFLDD
jgi:hypothetical protein